MVQRRQRWYPTECATMISFEPLVSVDIKRVSWLLQEVRQQRRYPSSHSLTEKREVVARYLDSKPNHGGRHPIISIVKGIAGLSPSRLRGFLPKTSTAKVVSARSARSARSHGSGGRMP